MKEYDISGRNGPFYCPIRNCRLGHLINCNSLEVKEAVNYGKITVNRHALYHEEDDYNKSGCVQFSEQPLKIHYDLEGNPISADLPWPNSETELSFEIIAGLVPYGTDTQSLFIGTSEDFPDTKDELSKLMQEFDSLIFQVYKTQRNLLPPDPITIDEKEYEISLVGQCKNYLCVDNKGKMEINSLPLIPKE